MSKNIHRDALKLLLTIIATHNDRIDALNSAVEGVDLELFVDVDSKFIDIFGVPKEEGTEDGFCRDWLWDMAAACRTMDGVEKFLLELEGGWKNA